MGKAQVGDGQREGNRRAEVGFALTGLTAASPVWGSNSQTTRLWPQLKLDTQQTEPPRCPKTGSTFNVAVLGTRICRVNVYELHFIKLWYDFSPLICKDLNAMLIYIYIIYILIYILICWHKSEWVCVCVCVCVCAFLKGIEHYRFFSQRTNSFTYRVNW